ncbi:MAG TPA: hypothetical protein VMS64_15495 [Candidatus Methylomirabilis sp.]|nr:hypothetical protein [Candidatus Methylomirabilis sp.]
MLVQFVLVMTSLLLGDTQPFSPCGVAVGNSHLFAAFADGFIGSTDLDGNNGASFATTIGPRRAALATWRTRVNATCGRRL